MTYRILKISKKDKSLFKVVTMYFDSREDMISYCLEMDNELFFYYGAETY